MMRQGMYATRHGRWAHSSTEQPVGFSAFRNIFFSERLTHEVNEAHVLVRVLVHVLGLACKTLLHLTLPVVSVEVSKRKFFIKDAHTVKDFLALLYLVHNNSCLGYSLPCAGSSLCNRDVLTGFAV